MDMYSSYGNILSPIAAQNHSMHMYEHNCKIKYWYSVAYNSVICNVHELECLLCWNCIQKLSEWRIWKWGEVIVMGYSRWGGELTWNQVWWVLRLLCMVWNGDSQEYILFVLVLPDSTIFSGSQNVIYIKSSEHVSTL